MWKAGLDIGSTTIKCVVLDEQDQIAYQIYERHYSHILEKTQELLRRLAAEFSKGEKVQLIGFGTFEVRERKAREGHNPSTQEVIKIPASKTPAFRVSKQLKEKVNVKPAKKTRAKKAAKK